MMKLQSDHASQRRVSSIVPDNSWIGSRRGRLFPARIAAIADLVPIASPLFSPSELPPTDRADLRRKVSFRIAMCGHEFELRWSAITHIPKRHSQPMAARFQEH